MCSSRRNGSVSSPNAWASPARARGIKSTLPILQPPFLRRTPLLSLYRRRTAAQMGGPSPTNFPQSRRLHQWLLTTPTKGSNEMGKIVMGGPQNVTLDGVVQDPDGAEGFRLGGWFGQSGGA